MINILKAIVVSIIIVLMSFVVVTSLLGTPSDIALFILIGLGIALMIFGILSNVKAGSPIRIGVINRAEFYGMVVAMVSYMIYMNTRIDQIMFKLMG